MHIGIKPPSQKSMAHSFPLIFETRDPKTTKRASLSSEEEEESPGMGILTAATFRRS